MKEGRIRGMERRCRANERAGYKLVRGRCDHAFNALRNQLDPEQGRIEDMCPTGCGKRHRVRKQSFVFVEKAEENEKAPRFFFSLSPSCSNNESFFFFSFLVSVAGCVDVWQAEQYPEMIFFGFFLLVALLMFGQV